MLVATESVATRTSEADLRSDLLLVLGPFVTEVLGLSPRDIHQEGTGASGRYDSMFGRAIVEYKRPNLLRTKKAKATAAKQAIAYLEDSRLGASIVIVTDGATWGILRDSEALPETGEQAWFDFGDKTAKLLPEQRFAWLPVNEMTLRRVLTLLSSVRAAPVNAVNITSRLGPGRAEVLELLEILASKVQRRNENTRTDALFREWVKQAGVTYGIDTPTAPWPKPPSKLLDARLEPILGALGYAEAIFVLHTYVGIACKLLACEVLAVAATAQDLRPTQWVTLSDEDLARRISDLESGHLTEELRAPGILAGDLFGWYAGHLVADSDLSSRLRSVIAALAELAWAQVATAGGVAVDLLRSFYQSVVSRGIRKYLGEFFTPRYVAERMLAKATDLSDRPLSSVRILDPACGSGTFLVAALRGKLTDLDARGEGDSPDAIAQAVESVIGFDINPISAVMSQVNLLLALGARANRLPSVRLNVYHADSILHPLFSSTGEFVNIPTEVGDFHLPAGLANLRKVSLLTNHIARGLQNDRSSEQFRARLRTDLSRDLSGNSLRTCLDGAVRLYSQIVDLHHSDKDGVWSRFIEHALAPQLLDAVDVVVGNPPWISWKALPDSWKKRSGGTWRRWGLWHEARKGSGVPLSDISVLLTARSLISYCNQRGIVAMLLPQSALIADPGGRPFRRCHLRSELHHNDDQSEDLVFDAVHVDDFSAIKPFSPDASNLPVALYLRPGRSPSFPVPATIWTRSVQGIRLDANSSWSAASFRLSAEETELQPVDEDDIESPWGRKPSRSDIPLLKRDERGAYQWGRGFETRGLDGVFFCEILTDEPFGPDQIVRIRTRPDLGVNTRGDPVRTAEVEAEFLWPLVKGRDVNSWLVARTELYCIVPYRDGRSLTIDQLREESPLLFDHLEPLLPRLVARSLYRKKPDASRPWTLSGPFEHLDHNTPVVLTRYIASGGRPVAAVDVPTFVPRLGRETIALPNNKCNILFTSDIAEAHYLAAWLNSGPATTALERFAASTGITPVALQRLPVPRFNLTHRDHRILAAMGQRCAEEVRAGLPLEPRLREINTVVEAIAWSYIAELRPGEVPRRHETA